MSEHEKISKRTLPPKEDRLRQAEVAELFETSVQTIIRWRREGKVPFFKIGRVPIFSKKELSEIASKNRHLLK